MLEMQQTLVRPLGGEDPLEFELATHCNILAGKIPQMEEPGGLQSMRLQSRTGLSTWADAHTASPHLCLGCGDPTVSPDIAKYPLGDKTTLVEDTALKEEKHVGFMTLTCSL